MSMDVLESAKQNNQNIVKTITKIRKFVCFLITTTILESTYMLTSSTFKCKLYASMYHRGTVQVFMALVF